MQDKKAALFPTYARFPLTLVKGEGSKLWDDQGNEYLDFFSGLAVTNLGHAHPAVKAAVLEQADILWHVSNLYHIPGQEKLAEELTAASCADRAFFCNSGAEANEAAIKLARRYHQLVRREQRYEIVTFHQSFHGRTLATLTATGQDKVKEGFAPLPEGFVYANFNDMESVKKAIHNRTAAVMLETVQAEGGVHVADQAFLKELAALCREQGILLILDEVQTGMGRTGKLFSYEHFGIEPDIFTLAKGLGNGYPIGAVLAKEKLAEAFSPGSHGSTFGGNPMASAVARAVLRTMQEEKLPERAHKLGANMVRRLQEALQDNPFVREVRGLGLLIGIACTEPVADLVAQAREQGLLVVTAGPNVIRLLPNLLLTEEEMERGLDVLTSLLAKQTVGEGI
ncbi:acetylornithine aminotransferase [Xylanibacillus composti]|uniref:Acetylornithine aminotransferase n=1 Tax=Xylanibacillus composti TaxID=1572762 RepID=A0A8J4H5M8_9BACL|nr:acetylornithine transaminase [Xylanibacillus composti]GIQ70002.1 acetylornithine aminotransferase [Xylanibacillus composti]